MRKPRQSQDRPQNKLRVAKKRARLAKLFAEGKTVRAASKQLKAEGFTKGTSRSTIGEDLQLLAKTAVEHVEEARIEAGAELRDLKLAIKTAKRLGLKDQVQLLLQVHDRYARLLGLDAPAKSVTANFSQLTPEYVEVAKVMADVDRAKLPQFMERFRALAEKFVKPLELKAEFFPPEVTQ
jgi:hypothetical protein